MISALTDLSSSSASRGKMHFLDKFFQQWSQHSFLLIYAKEGSIASLNDHNLTMTHQKWMMLYWSKECMSWFFITLSRRPLWLMKCWYLIHRVDAVANAARYAWESRTIICVFVCSEKHKGCVHRGSVYSSWPSDGFRMTRISGQDFTNLSS